MDPKERALISDNLSTLSKNCNFDNILGYLENQFTERQLLNYRKEEFLAKTEESKCEHLFQDLLTRGPNAFNNLLKCFRETRHFAQFKILSGMQSGRVAEVIVNCEVKLKKSERIYGPSQSIYKMTSNPRGYFIFINNIEFQKHPRRNGAEKDVAFEKLLLEMGYSGDYYTNQSKMSMWKLLKEFADREDLSNVDSIIVAISSHGKVTPSKEMMIYSCDDADESDPVLVHDVISLFNNCKLPHGQPKIFCINACRDDDESSERIEVVHKLNMWRDTFLLAPCFEGTKANRFPEYGTWLFQALIEVFENHACDKDLDQMKNLINDKFEEFYESSFKVQTLSYYKYGVSKRLFFNPGL